MIDIKRIELSVWVDNVNAIKFYEKMGFAKPTILLAENVDNLPFDVSPFRVLIYENSIAGKRKIEEGLKKHIKEIVYKR